MTSNIIGLGHDLIEISRIQKVLDRFGSAFLQRIFTQEELKYCLSIKMPTPSLAARFAAKEAVAKALGCGFGKHLGWYDIEIIKDPLGKPLCRLSLKALEHFGKIEILITLTHTHTHASAVAIAIKHL